MSPSMRLPGTLPKKPVTTGMRCSQASILAAKDAMVDL
jgi:hypothetical protein